MTWRFIGNIRGPKGKQGPPGKSIRGAPGVGDRGPMGQFPKHEWDGARLRLEMAPGQWGDWVDLRGERGEQQAYGPRVLIPGGGGIRTEVQEVELADSGESEHEHAVATVTDAGNTTVLTPSAGMQLKIYWISAIADPDSSDTPLLKIGFGTSGGSISDERYRVYALAKRQLMLGAVNQSLIVNLSAAASVAVSIVYDEV